MEKPSQPAGRGRFYVRAADRMPRPKLELGRFALMCRAETGKGRVAVGIRSREYISGSKRGRLKIFLAENIVEEHYSPDIYQIGACLVFTECSGEIIYSSFKYRFSMRLSCGSPFKCLIRQTGSVPVSRNQMTRVL